MLQYKKYKNECKGNSSEKKKKKKKLLKIHRIAFLNIKTDIPKKITICQTLCNMIEKIRKSEFC